MKKEEKKQGIVSKNKASKYYEAAEAGFWRIWKNKTIWFWGLFISAGTATSFSQNESNEEPIGQDVLVDFFASYWGWLLAGLILGLIFVLVAWIFSSIARAGVIQELDKKQNNKKHVLGFKKIWKVGLKDFKKVVGLDLFMLGIVFLAMLANLIMAIPFFVFENKILPSIILGITVLAGVLILVGMAILKPFAQVALLLADLNCKESFLRSWNIIKNNLRELVKLLLTCFSVSLIKGLIFVLISIAVVIIGGLFYLVFSGFGAGMFAEWSLMILGVILATIVFGAVLAIGGFFALWKMDILIWWVKEVDGIKSQETAKVSKVEVKKAVRLKKVTATA
jgi:hypothetical protein